MIRGQFEKKYDLTVERVFMSMYESIHNIYNLNVNYSMLTFEELDRMLIRIRYVRSNESNTVEPDGE